MTVKQISVFIENKSGGLREVTDLLAEAQVDIRALSIAETADFGILRLIVNDTFKAANALKDSGIVYSVTDVLAIEGEDKPGSMARVVGALADAGISLNYAYAFFTKSKDTAVLVIRVEDIPGALKVLNIPGIKILSEEEIHELL